MLASELVTICTQYEPSIIPYFRFCSSRNYFESNFENYLQGDQLNLFIVNSQDDSSPGIHWVLFAFNQNYQYFFDSFGKDLSFYQFDLPNLKWETAPFRCQSSDSRICGFYCIFVAFWLAKNRNLIPTIIKHFNPSYLKQNDLLVTQFIKNRPYGDYILTKKCPNDKYCILNYFEINHHE